MTSIMNEEQVISKIAELMETLDQIKKYNALTKSLKKFILIIGISIASFFLILTLFELFEAELTFSLQFIVIAFLSLLIPVAGLVSGVLFMQKQINKVKEGEWKTELSKGFSSSLKSLLDIDWDKTLDDISTGRIGYAIYCLLKAGTYLILTAAAFELAWNSLTFILLHEFITAGAVFWGVISILLVFTLISRDLWKRYKELRTLDTLVWELRWFSVEFGRAEFQT